MSSLAGARRVDPGLARLLGSDEPAIRHIALVELAGRPAGDPDVVEARRAIPTGRLVRGLVRDPSDGDRRIHPYSKWRGAHWRLVSLVDLGVPPDAAPLAELGEPVLDWLTGSSHRGNVPSIEGRSRRCASQEGNALTACSRIGLAGDDRVRLLATSLVGWQWPDGGWNCDRRPAVTHSSFHESWPALLGLAEYGAATGDRAVRRAVDRGAEFLLRHRVVFSERTGKLAHPALVRLRYPPYWHYDLLAGLKVLARSGHVADGRAEPALDRLVGLRDADGTWSTRGRWWKPPGQGRGSVDVVDWGAPGPSEPLTLGALRVLRAAGMWSPET